MHILIGIVTIVIGSYLVVCALLYVQQERLVFPRHRMEAPLMRESLQGALPFDVNVPERTGATRMLRLQGVHIPVTGNPEAPALLLYTGNMQDALFMAQHLYHLMAGQVQVFAVNYRGYGFSEGTPSEKALLSDALVVFDTVRASLPATVPLVLYGHSLGSSVATYVSSQRSVLGQILVVPIDGVVSLAAAQYPWVPVARLLKHPFNSVKHLYGNKTPTVLVHAEHDEVVPPAHQRRLQAAVENLVSVVTYPVGHSEAHLQKEFPEILRHSLKGFIEATPK